MTIQSSKYSDQEIIAFIQEQKVLPSDWRDKIQLREKRGHKEAELEIIGIAGNQFRLILRLSSINSFDFSVILSVCAKGTNQLFRLRRYNGKSHEHTDHIERRTFYDFHIHMATERYQQIGAREDTYAEPCNRYSDFGSALRCLMHDCHFERPDDPQLSLLTEVVS